MTKGLISNQTVLVTGAAGFIGFHTCIKLIKDKTPVIGFDNFNNYYDKNLKKDRIQKLKMAAEKYGVKIEIIKGDLENLEILENVFKGLNSFGQKLVTGKPKYVVHLAAQAGVRYSITNPMEYINSNLVGFANIIELCRRYEIYHLAYASSSSVYGGNKNLPFKENQNVDHPVSLYAATKKSNEIIAHSYSHLYKLPTTGLRFFTVYGPWGRPDMALFLFTKSILEERPIRIFNNGKMYRDFTYIDDVVESIVRIIRKPASPYSKFDQISPSPEVSWAPFRIFNVGNSNPVNLMDYVDAIEKEVKKKAIKIFEPIQPGDVEKTSASTENLENWINYKPKTSIKNGIKLFVNWYKGYYKV